MVRDRFTDRSTTGILMVEGQGFECFTLEDVVRPVKIPKETAIPAGTYEVAVTFSERFQRWLPLLLNVPNFEGVRIHPGNTAADTEGCILVGTARDTDLVTHSRDAFGLLLPHIRRAVENEKIFLEITEKR